MRLFLVRYHLLFDYSLCVVHDISCIYPLHHVLYYRLFYATLGLPDRLGIHSLQVPAYLPRLARILSRANVHVPSLKGAHISRSEYAQTKSERGDVALVALPLGDVLLPTENQSETTEEFRIFVARTEGKHTRSG